MAHYCITVQVANSQGMAVGSGAISLRGAQIMASIFEFLGAALVGQHVTGTVGSKIVDVDAVSPQQYAFGMCSAILSTAIWMFTATFFKMPVSSTHSIIGALMGFQLFINNVDPSSEHWNILGDIGISWIVTPFISFLMSMSFMYIIDRWWPLFIIDSDSLSKQALIVNEIEMDSIPQNDNNHNDTDDGNIGISENDKAFELSDHFDITTKPQPMRFSIIFAILSSTLILFILAAGPKSISILDDVSWWIFIMIGIGSFLFTMFIGYFGEKYFRKWYINKYYKTECIDNDDQDEIGGSDGDLRLNVGQKYKVFNNSDYFTLYLIIASASVAFAHGGNDVANVLGPFGQIFEYQQHGKISKSTSIPLWLAGMGGIAIGIGFILFGKNVLDTVGKKITSVNYQSGFIAQYSSALTVLICDILALPVSSSTVIIGAVSGVGFYNTKKESFLKRQMNIKRDENDIDGYSSMNCFKKLLFRLKRMNIKILLKIIATWIITIPCNAMICALIYFIIDSIFA